MRSFGILSGPLLFILGLLSACASGGSRPETMSAAMSRWNARPLRARSAAYAFPARRPIGGGRRKELRPHRQPSIGSVLAFRRSNRLPSGHVAVVSQVMGRRQILVTQANWVHHRVSEDQPVIDVSPETTGRWCASGGRRPTRWASPSIPPMASSEPIGRRHTTSHRGDATGDPRGGARLMSQIRRSGGVFATVTHLHVGQLRVVRAVWFTWFRGVVAEPETPRAWLAERPAAGDDAAIRTRRRRRHPGWRRHRDRPRRQDRHVRHRRPTAGSND